MNRQVSRNLLLAGGAALVLAGGVLGYRHFAPATAAAAPVASVEVARGDLVTSVTATGNAAAVAQSRVGFPSGGRVREVLVAVGDRVTAGQPLARLDDTALRAAVDQAQAGYDGAVAKLQQAQAGSRPEDLAAARAQAESARVALAQKRAAGGGPEVASARSQVEAARIKLEQTRTPPAGDVAAAQAELDAAVAKLQAVQQPRSEDVATARSQLASARAKLAQAQTPREEDVRTAQASLASAQAKLDALLHPRPEDLASAQSQLDQAQTKLAQLQDHPLTAAPQDLANAELKVNTAQIAYEQALADAAANAGPAAGSAAAPAGTSAATKATATQVDNDASIKQALITLQQAQNDLQKLKEQGPTAWDVRTAQQAVDQARAALDKAQHPAPEDVRQAQAAVDQAQASLDKARTPSASDVQQAQEGVIQAELALQKLTDPAPADVAGAQQAVVAAQTKLDKLVSPAAGDVRLAEEDLKQAQANLDKLLAANGFDVQSAQAGLDQAQANLDKALNGSTAPDLAQAQAAVDQAASQLQQAQADLANATLTAPFDGMVAALGVAAGEPAGAAGAAVTLVDTGRLRVEAVVAETDVARVRAGQAVVLTFDALPGVRADGRVEVVVPTAVVQNGVVNYTVYVALDPAQTPGLLPGMTATAQIVTDQHTDVLLAPNRAIARQGTERTVEVVDAAGAVATRPVQVGLSNDQVSEIVGGLQPGDRIALPAAARPVAAAAAPPARGLGAPAFGG